MRSRTVSRPETASVLTSRRLLHRPGPEGTEGPEGPAGEPGDPASPASSLALRPDGGDEVEPPRASAGGDPRQDLVQGRAAGHDRQLSQDVVRQGHPRLSGACLVPSSSGRNAPGPQGTGCAHDPGREIG